jgi:hypothetical protein
VRLCGFTMAEPEEAAVEALNRPGVKGALVRSPGFERFIVR